MRMLPVAMAIQQGAPKINACLLCVCEGHLYFLGLAKTYLRTGVKGYSKIRSILAKSSLILDKMCCLYGKFASYLRRVLCKMRLFFPRINGPIFEKFQVNCIKSKKYE